MFATFAPTILWFAPMIAAFAPTIAAFALGIFSKTQQSSLTLKGGYTSHLGLLPSGKKRETALRCSEPLRFMVVGPSKVSPGFAGLDRLE